MINNYITDNKIDYKKINELNQKELEKLWEEAQKLYKRKRNHVLNFNSVKKESMTYWKIANYCMILSERRNMQ